VFVAAEGFVARIGSAVLLAAVAVASLLAPGGGATVKVTRVTVTVSDSHFTLSRRSAPVGTVIFTVTNRGTKPHDFKIAGKKTSLLAPAHSAKLSVTFSKKGRYPYRSTLSGEAGAGLKGVFSVVAAPPPPYVPPTGTVGSANTSVAVGLFDASNGQGWITLSQTTIPSGMVTFVITNNCFGSCSFDLVGVKAGAILNERGQSETWTVALAPGVYRYHCDIDPGGMKGSFTVTA
jgi:plastocyanin